MYKHNDPIYDAVFRVTDVYSRSLSKRNSLPLIVNFQFATDLPNTACFFEVNYFTDPSQPNPQDIQLGVGYITTAGKISFDLLESEVKLEQYQLDKIKADLFQMLEEGKDNILAIKQVIMNGLEFWRNHK